MRNRNALARSIILLTLLIMTLGVFVLPGAAEGDTPSDEGCSPGYWKNLKKHGDWWADPYAPDYGFEDAFGVYAPNTHRLSLIEALNAKGGGEFALWRHATAALLNAASEDVDYFYSTAYVLQMVQDAYDSVEFEATKDLFEAANEAFCPLD